MWLLQNNCDHILQCLKSVLYGKLVMVKSLVAVQCGGLNKKIVVDPNVRSIILLVLELD